MFPLVWAKFRVHLQAPGADSLVGERDAAYPHHFLNITIADRKPEV